MKDLFAIELELEDFGQNVSHLVRKTYYTHDFFSDRQVYVSISRDFSFIGLKDWIFKRVPCTLAIPINVEKTRKWFSIKNVDLKKETDTNLLTYITEGHQEYLKPGSRFLTFSFLKPDKVLFIGKKGAIARVANAEKVEYEISNNEWTSLDLIYMNDYEKYLNKEIFEIRLKDASQRYLIGNFKVLRAVTLKYQDEKYIFFSLQKYLEEKNI